MTMNSSKLWNIAGEIPAGTIIHITGKRLLITINGKIITIEYKGVK